MSRKGRSVSLLAGILVGGLATAPIPSQEVLVDFGESWRFFRGTVAPSTPLAGWRQGHVRASRQARTLQVTT